MWLKWKKMSTHREASIGFIKYESPTIMLQTVIRSRIELALYSMPFTEEDIKHLVTVIRGEKRKTTNELDSNETSITEPNGDCEYAPIHLPIFNLSTKNIHYGNGKRRVSTTAFEVKCHPNNAALLKRILFKATTNDTMLPGSNNIHFVA